MNSLIVAVARTGGNGKRLTMRGRPERRRSQSGAFTRDGFAREDLARESSGFDAGAMTNFPDWSHVTYT